MLLVTYFISLLVKILLFCHETGANPTVSPPNPWTVLEGQNITFVWNYTLGSGIALARFINITGGGNDVTIAQHTGGSTAVADNFKARFSADISPTRAEITLHGVQLSDQGDYVFDLGTSSPGGFRSQMKLIVNSPPKFTNNVQDQTVNEGTDLQLFCEASGKPAPNITWTRVFEDVGNSAVLHRETTWNFPNINSSNAGTYRCTADNGEGRPVSHTVRVFVRFSPRITLDKKHYVARQANAYLHCRVEAYPQPTISWVPCNPQESTVCDRSFLNISNVQTPRANYTCTATNERGQDSETTTLVFGGKVVNISVTIITTENCSEGASWREQIIDEMDKIFMNGSYGYNHTKVLNCSLGSVIVDLRLEFSVPVAEDVVISSIRNAIQNGKLGELSVDASSIIGIPPVIISTTAPPTSTTTPKPGDNKTLIIVLSVIGGVLFLVLIAVGVACCIRMKNKKESREVDDHKGRKDGSQPSCPPPGAPGQNNTGYEEPGYANTSSAARTKKVEKDGKKPSKKKEAQQEEIPMYAQVDKSKKKPKPNSYSEVERPDRREPEIQYAVMDHSHPGGSMPRGAATQPRRAPETVYADLV